MDGSRLSLGKEILLPNPYTGTWMGTGFFILFPQNGIRILGIPSKVSFFMWNAFLDKILTMDHLQRGWTLANICVICLKKESVDHLFAHCAMAHSV